MKKLLLASFLGFLMSNAFCNTTASTGAYSGSGQNQNLYANLLDDTQPPTVPTGLVATNVTDTSFTLSWNPSTDDVGIAFYQVYKNGSWLGGTTDTFYNITGLSPTASYTFMVDAFDAAGNGSATSAPLLIGAADTEAPSIPQNLIASEITKNSVKLSWDASTDNNAVAAYQYYKDGQWVGGTTDLFKMVTDLTCGTTYSFSVDAFDGASPANISAQSTPVSVTTSACVVIDTEKPTVPTGLVISDITETSIHMAWNPSTDNVAVHGYEIYKNGGWAGATVDTFMVLTGLGSGSTFDISLSAFDDAGNYSSPTQPVSVTTLGNPDTEAPTIPTGIVISDITETTIHIAWKASTDNVSVHGYDIYKNGVWAGATVDTFKVLTGLGSGSTFNISLSAFDYAGNYSSPSQPVSVTTPGTPDTEKPTVPAGLVISDITETTIHMAWNPSTDNVSVHGYEIYKNGGWAGATVDTFMVLTGLPPGSTFNISLSAFDDAGNYSAACTAVSVTTLGPPDTEKPSTPTGLSVSNITETTIDLKWNPSTDNLHVFGYEIYADGKWAGATIDTFLTVKNLKPGTTVKITISAFDDASNLSIPSAPLSITTLGTPPPKDTEKPSTPTGLIAYNITQTSVALSWNPSTDNVHVFGYEIYKNGGWAGATVDTFLVLKDLPKGSTFNITASAFDDASNISVPCKPIKVTLMGDSDTQAPSVPGGIVASLVTDSSFTLTWAASTDDVHVFGYEIFLDGVWAGATTETTYNLKDLSCGKTYNVQLDAFDDAGNISEKSSGLAVATADCDDVAIPVRVNANIEIWPNPVSTTLHIKNVPADAIISVTTVQGKMLSKIKANDKTVDMDMSNWNKGIYLFRIQSGRLVKVEKVIVE